MDKRDVQRAAAFLCDAACVDQPRQRPYGAPVAHGAIDDEDDQPNDADTANDGESVSHGNSDKGLWVTLRYEGGA